MASDAALADPFGPRLERMRAAMADAGLDGVVIAAPEPLSTNNVRYLSGFSEACSCHLVVSLTDAWLLTDPRFTEFVADQAPHCHGIRHERNDVSVLARVCLDADLRRMGFEADKLSVEAFESWRGVMPGPSFSPLGGMVERLRLVKDPVELAHIRRAASVADDALRPLLATLRGRSEASLAAAIDTGMREAGLDGPGFPTIVGSGLRSYVPHSKPTTKLMDEGDVVIIDFGGTCEGYRSDETVTVAIGAINGQIRDIFDIVQAAQEAGIGALRPGAQASDVDRAAREVISRAGYGHTFRHGTGHGVGLDVHEAPSTGKAVPAEPDHILEPGMTLTVEPGIYLPELGGVRLEDTFVVTEHGCERLTGMPKTWTAV